MLPPPKRDRAGAPPSAKTPFEPKTGSIVDGKYVVERVLGEGGMGVVVAATHLGLDQRVAIKFLTRKAMRNKEAVERFLREAKVAAKVRSEHVARVHDVGTVDGGGPYIVMEYLEGRDLGQVIDEHGRLPLGEACEIALQACEALAEVHAAGIVHRDLKPSNLFVTRRSDGSPSVKLLDFGISKFVSHADDASVDPALTATATLMGSPAYMSPEQLKSTKEVDARTDVWSLGAVLYEALTGKPAFRAETVPQVCAMIAADDPAPPSSLRSSLAPELERAVLACLEKKPEKRSSLLDLSRALVKWVPDRGRASLERIEAVAASSEQRPRIPTLQPVLADEGKLPIVPLGRSERPPVPLDRAATELSWREGRFARRSGAGPFTILVLVALGVFGAGLYWGKIRVRGLRQQVASATSVVTSAVASAVESAIPMVESALPPLPPVPSTEEATQESPVASSASPTAATPPPVATAPPPVPAHAAAPVKKPPPKPRHHPRPWKKHR